MSFGEEIRRERELRQISLREVAQATKINLRYLEAMERNEFGYLPGGLFNRAFVRKSDPRARNSSTISASPIPPPPPASKRVKIPRIDFETVGLLGLFTACSTVAFGKAPLTPGYQFCWRA